MSGTRPATAQTASTPATHVDVLVVGSGFGGSVAALRLSEKGYRVTVVEAGRRFTRDTLPRNSWDLRRFLWLPRLGCHGIQKITMLGRVLVLSGAAVGGGSLVYANTLYRPLVPFYDDQQWRAITDWRDELAPFYDQAERMFGVVENPTTTYMDTVFRSVAEELGVGHTYSPARVAVFFGTDPAGGSGAADPGAADPGAADPGAASSGAAGSGPAGSGAGGAGALGFGAGVEVADPYFGGVGPSRTGCVECGECMSGCRHNAKNTLDHNYLYLAENLGATIVADTRVTAIVPLEGGGYEVRAQRCGPLPGRETRTWHAGQVVLAAGALGTQRLLLSMRDGGVLPNLSTRLGELTRTNSEAILGASRFRPDERITRGVAITSSFYPNEHTHIEPVRYGKGSNLMAGLATMMVDGGGRMPRWLAFLGAALRRPHLALLACLPWRWSERTMISLVMQSRDNSLTVVRRRGPFGISWLTSRQGHGEPNPTWIPEGNDATRRIAKAMGGYPGGAVTELANMPVTAHILGGAVIGDSPRSGVIDPYQRVYGHPGLHVVDGAAVSANLGVNPSLTIAAQAERAMAFWPNKGEADQRPALGQPYRRLDPVPPVRPAVPDSAPAAYRIGGLAVVSREGRMAKREPHGQA